MDEVPRGCMTYFRNWEGRDGAEWGPGMKVKTRPTECPWCGHKWNTRVPESPVCPKCNLSEGTAIDLLEHPEWEKQCTMKTRSMKNKFTKKDIN